MVEERQFDTEGDVRQFLQDNEEKAVKAESILGDIWFWTDGSGLQVTLDPLSVPPEEGPSLGDDKELDGVQEIHGADAVPERER